MKDLTYIEDIAQELADEHMLSYTEALEICKLNVDFIYELMEDPNIVTINLPLLGNLHFNYKRGRYAGKFKSVKNIIESQVKIVERMLAKQKDQVHGRNSYFTILKNYFYPNKDERHKIKRREVFRRIEEKQNN